jgi:two-component sensor histidine kinase
MSETLRVLQIEDSESDAALIVRIMEKGGYAVEVHRVQNAPGMREALANALWDIIIADYHMPQFDAPTALGILHETGLDIPFIVVSGVVGEDVAVQMMKSGAHDYVMKNSLARLPPAVTRELRDATTRRQRKEAEEALRKNVVKLESALAEKTVLLKEVHHRVKNNLAMISSLLALKADATLNGEARQVLEDCQRQVHSIATIHEHLYGNDRLDRIDFASYVGQLVHQLYEAGACAADRISVQMDIAPLELAIGQAVPCALILNELLLNTFKHAFPGGRYGEVRISFGETGTADLELAVEDNGVGSSVGLDMVNSKSLGLRIVGILTKQLDGFIEKQPAPGTRIVLRFPRLTG